MTNLEKVEKVEQQGFPGFQSKTWKRWKTGFSRFSGALRQFRVRAQRRAEKDSPFGREFFSRDGVTSRFSDRKHRTALIAFGGAVPRLLVTE